MFCLQMLCVSLERSKRLALGPLVLLPVAMVQASVIQSQELAERGEGVSQRSLLPRNIQLTSPTWAPPRAEE